MNIEKINPDEVRLRLPDVEQLTGMRRSTIYRKIAAGDFPKPLRIGMRCSVWIAGEIRAWNEQQQRIRDNSKAA